MKLYTLLLLCFIYNLNAQSLEQLEVKAQKLYAEGNKTEAIKAFEEIYSKYPDAKNTGITLYNIAITYEETKNEEMAIEWYNKILTANFKDNEEYYSFPDTHTNIKHRSALGLGNIYYNREDNIKASQYYLMALQEFPYYSTSGTSTKKNNTKIRKWLADCYINLDMKDKVVNTLLSDAVTYSPWASNPSAKNLSEYIKKNLNKEEFLKDFDKALLTMKKEGDNYTIQLYNEKVAIVPYGSEPDRVNDMVIFIKEGEFYKSLKEK